MPAALPLVTPRRPPRHTGNAERRQWPADDSLRGENWGDERESQHIGRYHQRETTFLVARVASEESRHWRRMTSRTDGTVQERTVQVTSPGTSPISFDKQVACVPNRPVLLFLAASRADAKVEMRSWPNWAISSFSTPRSTSPT